MMPFSSLANRIEHTTDSSSRDGRTIDRFIVHHAATTSLSAILSLFQPGGRTVSANYALGSDGTLVGCVDETRRAWTSASASWDGRAVTIEVANSVAGDPWPVSAKAFDKLARLIADVSARYGFAITDDTVLTHQELYKRYGASYATACPGDLQRRKGELLALARKYRAAGAPASGGTTTPVPTTVDYEEEDEMRPKFGHRSGTNEDEWILVHPEIVGENGEQGYRITKDPKVAERWSQLYKNGWQDKLVGPGGRYDFDLDRTRYIEMQWEASNMRAAFLRGEVRA